MGSAMVPLDRALLGSYRLSAVTIPLSLTVWLQFAMQDLTEGSTVSNTMLVRTIRVSLPNGISFRPMVVHESGRRTQAYRQTTLQQHLSQ